METGPGQSYRCDSGFCQRGWCVEFAGGMGTPSDPYEIVTPEQLIAIGLDPDLQKAHFILIDDLDLDVAVLSCSKPWPTAGSNATPRPSGPVRPCSYRHDS